METESSEIGGTVNEKEINNLILNGRDFKTLAIAIPGVTSVVGTDQQTITTGNQLGLRATRVFNRGSLYDQHQSQNVFRES